MSEHDYGAVNSDDLPAEAVTWATAMTVHSTLTGHGEWFTTRRDGEPYAECVRCGWTTDAEPATRPDGR